MNRKPYDPLDLSHFCSGNCPTCVARKEAAAQARRYFAELRARWWRNFWCMIAFVSIVGGCCAAMMKVHNEAKKAELWYQTYSGEKTVNDAMVVPEDQ